MFLGESEEISLIIRYKWEDGEVNLLRKVLGYKVRFCRRMLNYIF